MLLEAVPAFSHAAVKVGRDLLRLSNPTRPAQAVPARAVCLGLCPVGF